MGTGQIFTKTFLHEGSFLYGESILHESKNKKLIKEKKKPTKGKG